jgi:2-polyprenyl-3-methyl-5-hydroxy-6-metoxy-1,4-benzoquinol methylase
MIEKINLLTSKPASYYWQSRKEMLPFVPPHFLRVLDVGCGSGCFGELLKVSFPDIEVWGVEPVLDAQVVAARVLDHAGLGNFEAALNLPKENFDVIVFNDCLEHFPDHVPALALVVSLLKPGGSVVASIPNIRYWPHVQQYLFEGEWHYEAAGVLDRTHLRFFTRKSMLREFAAVGLHVDEISGINPCWLSWKFRLLRILMRGQMTGMPFQQFALRAVKPIAL